MILYYVNDSSLGVEGDGVCSFTALYGKGSYSGISKNRAQAMLERDLL